MPYFVDAQHRVVIVEPGVLAPPGHRVIMHDVATAAGLADGQQLSAPDAELLVDGKIDTYRAGLTDAERDALPVVSDRERPIALLPAGLPMTTTAQLPGSRIVKVLGVVAGNTVRTRNALSRIGAGLMSNFGGELEAYTKLLVDSRNEAVTRMVHDARTLGANAIVGVFFATSELLEIATEVLVFGTAVRVEPET